MTTVLFLDVDDDTDMLPEQEACFVQTTFETGLLDAHAARLIDMLTGRRWVEVCPSCLTASCRRGVFRCFDAGEAFETRTLGELAMMDLEHAHWWEPEK